MSQVRPGILIAIIIFAVFAAYAYLAPATYRTSALLIVESTPSAKLPEPLEAARRLSEGILDRVMLERLAKERASSGAPEARAAAGSQVRQSLEIDTSDARAFSIGYRDTNKDRVQRACNDLARHAAELAPILLRDRSAERDREQQRQQQTQELAAFLALHPEAAAETPPSAGQSPDKDPALSAFHAEQANLEARLAELGSGRGTDNPYLDPRESNPILLRRRLAEINSALSARREAFEAKAPAKVLSPELRSEWKRLLEAVTKTAAEGEVSSAPLVARIASVAPTPTAPIDPNRPLLLFFGVVFGGGLGSAYTLVARASQQRRTKSSRPPPPSPFAPNVELPPAPAIPSGLGPSVPSYQPPQPSPAPPIIPVPQRQISSSPPAAFDNTQRVAAPNPAAAVAQPRDNASSNPPPAAAQPRRFASTLVLPPAENPLAAELKADPVLASAARAWDDEIRAHAVPGFAVVRPGSEPPPAREASSAPPPHAAVVEAPHAHSPSPAPRSRPRNQMKVTQPLGSFLPELLLKESAALRGETATRTPEPSRSPVPRSPVAPRGASSPPASQSRYSYVSSVPPAENTVTVVRPAPVGWAPDATLLPALRHPVCEQLYPLAVEGCFVVVVVGVPDSLEQKSRVAAELALALAESGHPRILLIDGDTQNPRVHHLMHVAMPMSAGFSQQLRDRINGNSDRRWTVVSCGKTLHVMAEGMMRSPGLLLSRQFSDGLADLRNYYDFIVIDGPSASLPVESQALDAVAHGVVYVSSKQGSSALAQLQALFRDKRLQSVVTRP